MNDEIKEILDYLKDDFYAYGETNIEEKCKIVTKKENHQLLNYITNLQEENERLTRFKYNIPNDKTTSVPTITKSYKKEYENYKSRCEKAIDYIKKNKKEITKEQADFYNEDRQNKLKIGTFMWGVDELLNILNGGDEE